MRSGGPPHEPVADLSAFSIGAEAAERTHTPYVSVATSEAVGGEQILPVGVSLPVHAKFPPGVVVIRIQSWSASNEPPYQQARNQAYADSWGLPIVMPNTIGQGKDSPELTSLQAEELHNGRPNDIGRVTIAAALAAYEEVTGEKVTSVILLGESQGASLHPSIIENWPEGVELTHIIWGTPAGVKEGSRIGLVPAIGRTMIPRQDLAIYRRRNQAAFELRDTNIIESLTSQPQAHLLDYPAHMSKGMLARATQAALHNKGLSPEIHDFVADHDMVSPIADNADMIKLLGLNAELHRLVGHYHTVTDHIGLIALRYAQVLGITVPILTPRPKQIK
jgi:hypothetical protein